MHCEVQFLGVLPFTDRLPSSCHTLILTQVIYELGTLVNEKLMHSNLVITSYA